MFGDVLDKAKKVGGGLVKTLTGIDVSSGPGDAIFGKVKGAQAGDSSNYDYGGNPEYAQQMRDYYGQRANAAWGRGAYELDRSAADGAMAGFGGAMRNDQAGRSQQLQALRMYRDAAMGNAPSVAAAQMQRGLQDANLNARNQAASAIGANPLLANANAIAAGQDAARRSTTDATMLRAQEIDAARAGYAGLAGAMRSADQAAGQQWLGAGQFGMGVEQAQAGLEMQQRGLNDAQAQAYEQYRLQMERDALAARMGYGNAQTQASMANASNSLGRRAQNQQFVNNTFDSIGKAFGGAGMGGG